MMNQLTPFRGSRLHVLDWVEHAGAEFPASLDTLLQPTGIRASGGPWLPRGHADPREALLDRPGDAGLLSGEVRKRLREWWLAVDHRYAEGPNWDLAAAADFPNGRKGLVLIEAKAHAAELSIDGKKLDACSNLANHQRIGAAIAEAREALGGAPAGVGISHASHYQLANRVAFAWKLARLGVPTVLIYLGFTGDAAIGARFVPIGSDAHWRTLMADHALGIMPPTHWERDIGADGAPLWLLVRSRPALRQSPPAPSRKPVMARRQTSLMPPPTAP